jgi:hypothetical protein
VFLKENKKAKENYKYAPTDSIRDEDGKPVEFEFKHLTTSEDRLIRESCVLGGKFNSTLYTRKLIAACVVYPNLYDKELQDSYGVYTPEDLLECIVDNPSEWYNLSIYVQKELGFIGLDEAITEAKN